MSVEDATFQISALKKELEDKEKNLLLAAQIGKDLLDQNAELNNKWEECVKESGLKIEELKQEIYSLTLNLQTKANVIQNAQAELDQQEKLHQGKLDGIKQVHQESIEKLNKKISCQETTIENLQSELQFNFLQVNQLQKALQESYKVTRETSSPPPNESEDNDASSIQEKQLEQLTSEKQTLEKEVNHLNFLLKSCQHQLENAKASQQSLAGELEEKECELTTLFNTLQKTKEENQELQVEMDNMKLQETDLTRKGNSIFAEVEDNRKALEKKMLSLREKLEVSNKQCEIKTGQISKMKLQIASLLLLSKSEMDQGYINHLEESLYEVRKELQKCTSKCQEYKDLLQQKSMEQEVDKDVSPNVDSGSNDFYEGLYHQSRKKISELEAKIETLIFNKVSLADQLHEVKRKAYLMERERERLNGKIIQLDVKIEELQGDQLQKEEVPPKHLQTKTEILPFFKELKGNERGDAKEISTGGLHQNSSHPRARPATRACKSALEEKENRPTFPSSCTFEDVKEKRIKKSLKLAETVKVFEVDSKVTELDLKENDGGNKPKKLPKSLRRVEAPHIIESECRQPDECKQQ